MSLPNRPLPPPRPRRNAASGHKKPTTDRYQTGEEASLDSTKSTGLAESAGANSSPGLTKGAGLTNAGGRVSTAPVQRNLSAPAVSWLERTTKASPNRALAARRSGEKEATPVSRRLVGDNSQSTRTTKAKGPVSPSSPGRMRSFTSRFRRGTSVQEAKGKRWNLGGLNISVRFLALTVVVALALINLVPLGLQWFQQEQEYRAIQAEVSAAIQRNEELREALEDWENEDYIAAQARKRLGYVRKGETQFSVTDLPEDFESGTAEETEVAVGPAKPWTTLVLQSLKDVDVPPVTEGLMTQVPSESEPKDGEE